MEIDMARTLARSAPQHASQLAAPVTRHDEESERDRSAFNAAFHELGLRWQWDAVTYDALVGQPCERERLRRYLAQEQAHLLRAYDAEFLADAILAVKARRRAASADGAPQTVSRPPRFEARWDEVGF
jgi:hypothetical protein